MIDFKSINAAALPRLGDLLPRWLPGGRIEGVEFVAGDLSGAPGRSLSVNMETGVWCDFAGNARGSDSISLWAAIRGLKQGEAAQELARELGVTAESSRPRVTSRPVDLLGKGPKDQWRPILPVPGNVSPPPDVFRRKEDGRWIELRLVARWTYWDENEAVLGHICRFERPGGGKEIIPQTWCETLDGKTSWRWKSFPEPRPLYGLDRLAVSDPEALVLMVEGEKACDAAQRLMPNTVAMTWPSGSKAVGKADFTPLSGRHVVIWPDADKPGAEAALAVADALAKVGAGSVQVISPPDGVAGGWDLADAEAEGWDAVRVREHQQGHWVEVAAFAVLARKRFGFDQKAKAASAPTCAQADEGVIRIEKGSLSVVVDACEAILARPDLPTQYRAFQRGGQLVRVASLPASAMADGVSRPQGAVVIMEAQKPFLLDVLGRFGRFEKFDGRSGEWRTADPPKDAAETILSRAGLWPVPTLRGVVACPTMRVDGSLLLTPGYDAASGYFMAHRLAVEVPDAPGLAEAQAALDALAALLAGFAFVEPLDCSVALALILTAVVRPALATVPVVGITAPVRGSGKSTLMDIAAVVATGRRSAVLSATANHEEMEKRLVGCLLSGDSIINLDNVNGNLKSDLLCQATTCESVKVRPLGASSQVEIPNTALWSANGNNLSLAGDLSRRALLCRLDPGMERPEERSFAFDPVVRAMERRAEYVAAALTVMRAYVAAGRPDLGLSPFGSFEQWSAMVRAAMVWAGAADPCDSREAVMEDDPEAVMLRALVAAWWERFGRTPRTVKEIVRAGEEDDSPLAEVLHDIAGEGRVINTRRLGWWLRRQMGRIVNGMKLTQDRTSRVADWRVLPAEE